MAALCNPQVVASEVSRLIGQQPGLYARVLRVANSPYHGQGRSITSVDRAIVVLGFDAVRGIAAAACLDRTMPRKNQPSLIDLESVLQHSIATGAAAQSLARICRPALAGEAFIAGLLHNLGILVQMALDAPGVSKILQSRAADDRRDVRALEIEHAAVGHEACVAVIFEAWHLPQALIAAVAHHHEPMAANRADRDLAVLINLGATVALASGSTHSLEPHSPTPETRAMAWIGAEPSQLDAIAAELPRRVAEFQRALRGT
jgi:HD-like signal output (HDOD) protein